MRRRETLIVSLAIAVVSLVYYGSYFRDFRIDVDEGLLINGTMRVLSGQLPLRDFHQYTPGPYYSMAAWFLLFGKSILVERLFFVLLHLVKNILMYRLARRLLPLPLALLPCALMLALPGFWIKGYIGIILLVNLALLWKAIEAPSTRAFIWLGLAIGAGVYFREDMAGYSAVTAGLIIILANWLRREPFKRIVREGLVLGLSIAAALLPMLVLYGAQGALPDLVRGIGETVRLGQVESLDTTRVADSMPWPPRLVKGYLYYLTPLFLLGFGIGLARRLGRRAAAVDLRSLMLAATVLLTTFSFYHVWHWHNEYRFPQTGIFLHLLWAVVLWHGWRLIRGGGEGPGGKRSRVRAVAGGGLIVIALLVQVYFVAVSWAGHYMWVYDGASIALKQGAHAPIAGAPRARITPPADQAAALSALIAYIKRETGPADRIFAFGESILYFLADRKNATEFDNGRIPAYFPRQRLKWVEQMKTGRPKIVFLRKWEYDWWYPKMPEAFDAVLPEFLLDREIANYYVLVPTRSPDPDVRRGSALMWGGDLAGAAAAYGRALRADPYHFRLIWNLGRLYFGEGLWQKAGQALDGFAVRRGDDSWEIRWGTAGRGVFSGRLLVEGTDAPARILAVEPAPLRGSPVRWSQEGPEVRFEADTAAAAAGLSLYFAKGARVRFELRRDDRPVLEVFDSERGWEAVPPAIR